MKVPAYQRKKQNKLACFCISLVVAMLLGVVAVDGMRLLKRYHSYQDKAAEIRSEIEAEHQRTAELEEFEKYTHTKKYAEEVAKEKLGLIHEGEIIFKPENHE